MTQARAHQECAAPAVATEVIALSPWPLAIYTHRGREDGPYKSQRYSRKRICDAGHRNRRKEGVFRDLLQGWRTAMAIIIAQTHRVSGFFGKIAQRLYDARLATAEREVNRHRQFLRK